jgi:hypothetical protein
MLRSSGWREVIPMLDAPREWGIRTAIGAAALVACGLSPAPARAALVPGPDGATVYDTVDDITWLADADFPATNRFWLPLCNGSTVDRKTCVNPSGSMSYQAATAWVDAMNAARYLGHSNWQLPTTPSLDGTCPNTGPNGNSFGFDCSSGALASLYYHALGLQAPDTAVPIPINSVGPFSNFQPYLYWSQSGTGAHGYSTFSFNNGWVGSNTAENFLYVLPMIPGKLPGAPAATGTGLQVSPGGQTVYDPVADVTWLANADLAATNSFGLPSCTSPTHPKPCVEQDGAMDWDSASQFIANMNSGAGYLGQTTWELPPVDQSCTQYNCSSASSPLGELFYRQLGLGQGTPVVAAPGAVTGPFRNLQPYLYWGCEAATVRSPCLAIGPATGFEWSFSFGNGFLGTDVLANEMYVTAYFVGSRTSAGTADRQVHRVLKRAASISSVPPRSSSN